MDRAQLESAKLQGMQAQAVSLRNAHLDSADVTGSSMDYADLTEAYLVGARFVNVDLSDASLAGAKAGGADFSGAKLKKADCRGTIFEERGVSARGLTLEQIRSAVVDDKSILPAYLRAVQSPTPVDPRQPWTLEYRGPFAG